MSKIKGRGGDVSEAIETLAISVKDFQDEANTCSQIMLGRTHDGMQQAQVVLGKTYDRQEDLASMVDQILKNQTHALTGQEEMKKYLANICNALYSMLTAEKTFKSRQWNL